MCAAFEYTLIIYDLEKRHKTKRYSWLCVNATRVLVCLCVN